MKNKIYNYIDNLKKVLDSFDVDALEKIIKLFISARDNKKTIYVFGNGGSGSTASHMVCDIIKGCSYEKEKNLK